MNRMHRIIEGFDHFFSTAIIFVYLAAMMLGTGTYFLGHSFTIAAIVTVAIAFSLSTATEVHSFLEQRRSREFYLRWQRAPQGSDEAKQLRAQFLLHLGLTFGLVGFSIFNGIAFWALESHAVTTGDWISAAFRGVIIPILFLGAGFLVPLHADPREAISTVSTAMLGKVLRVTLAQFSRRVDRIARSGADLTPLAIALTMHSGDATGANILGVISYHLALAEGNDPPDFADLGPFGGPGSPTVKLMPDPSDAETRIRVYLDEDPTASPSQIAHAVGVSISTASKYWRIYGTPTATTAARTTPRGRPRRGPRPATNSRPARKTA